MSNSAGIGGLALCPSDGVWKDGGDSGWRSGVSAEMAAKMQALERKTREGLRVREILRRAGA